MSEHRWPPQPGDLVKVEGWDELAIVACLGVSHKTVRVEKIGEDWGTWVCVSDLSAAEPPQTIEQFGRTYRLVEGWQPIETAPHGEKVVLAWQRQDGTFTMCVDRASWDWRLGDYRSGQSRHHKATHWMPLPAGPSTKEPTP